ncbi:hypothetical protein LOTGIDRAFT_157685 [Lottia gigantea]|uniref:CARD domain-containing protein n=1 Tax=Lottia gigantea TaxID=225164 RepID=V4AT77_LOTGI|nr:hypothetical protein LOTGIDRAFT_157685 [Lottia gigantea]ESP00478.1 hypothetical protein LOTGIDRAFT_157685 [Lottia gigantea]
MMNLTVVTSLLVMVAISLQSVSGIKQPTRLQTIMMNLTVVTSLLVMVAISLQPVEAAGRRCWCDARVNDVVIKNFDVIDSCGGWCGCGDNRINRCGLTCDEKVQDWVETVCLQKYKGQQVRSHFKASNCKTGDGSRTYTCNLPKLCTEKVTENIVFTQTVTTCGTASEGMSGSSKTGDHWKKMSKKSRGSLPDADRSTLQYFHVRLKTDICLHPLIDHLFNEQVIDQDELDIITTTKERSGRASGVEKMLEILRFSGRQAFHLFLECLENKDVGYEELAKELRKHRQTLLPV